MVCRLEAAHFLPRDVWTFNKHKASWLLHWLCIVPAAATLRTVVFQQIFTLVIFPWTCRQCKALRFLSLGYLIDGVLENQHCWMQTITGLTQGQKSSGCIFRHCLSGYWVSFIIGRITMAGIERTLWILGRGMGYSDWPPFTVLQLPLLYQGHLEALWIYKLLSRDG